ncbi:MAG: hypothetical protein AAFV25_06905 [Bacteroidota bacterium]
MSELDLIDFINQLFTSLDNKDSIIILLFLLGAFLIGWIFRWFSLRRKLSGLRQRLKQKEGSLITTKANYEALQSQFDTKDGELDAIRLQSDQLDDDNKKLEMEKAQLQTQYYEQEEQLKTAQIELEQYRRFSDTIDDSDFTKGDYVRLMAQVEALQLDKEQLISINEQLDSENEALRVRLQQIGVGNGVLFEDKDLQTNGIASEEFQQLRRSQQQQSEQLNALESKLIRLERDKRLFVDGTDQEENEEEEIDVLSPDQTSAKELAIERAKQSIRDAIGTLIPKADESQKDNLQQLKGVGPFIEKQLNDLGIFTFQQISQLNSALIEELTEAIQFFPGRIKKDDWIGQAGKLAN